MQVHILTLFSFTFLLYWSNCLEEPVREEDLKPRHFNPHFLSNEDKKKSRIGPIVFPSNSEDEEISEEDRVSKIDSPQEIPYQKVAKKCKKKKIGRYGLQDEKINLRLEQALAKHGAKVLKLPPEKLAKDHVPFARDINKRQNYAFSYKVLDHSSGDDFSHSQVQDSSSTNGEYRVKLPDGRLQIVSYTADHNGYKADVKYTKSENDYRHDKHQSSVYQIEQIPVRQVNPIKQHHIDYYDEVISTNKPVAKVPTAIPYIYDGYDTDYGNIVVTPSPGYSNGAVSANANFQLPLPLNVQIYTTNARDYMIGSYVPVVASTPVTYHNKNINHYRQQLISPQIINNGDHGLVAPLSTPSSFILTDQQGQVIDNIKLVTSTAAPFLLSTTSSPLHLEVVHSSQARYK